MHGELRAALDAAAGDRAVRCVVVTGTGRGFCAGQDLADPAVAPNREAGGTATDVGSAIERFYKPLALRIRSMPMPVVAAVNGVAAGAGANFALLCDVVVAARSASFLQAFSKIGLIPDCGGTWLLPRLVGRARAFGLAMLADKLAAADAERIGLIWKCVDDDAFSAEVDALAARLATLPTKALVATRQALDASQQLDLAAALSLEADVQRTLGAAPDFAEGVAAFMAKRAPTFRDR
jgi:2-(1,2-epoxy-1,2-dihydrophenyl)acetyl-CoA isomerase